MPEDVEDGVTVFVVERVGVSEFEGVAEGVHESERVMEIEGVGETVAVEILRMRPLSESEMKTTPVESMANANGLLKEEAMKGPSANIADPFPASVETAPPGDILRTRLLSVSATMMLLFASMATAFGLKNEAPTPVPSANAPWQRHSNVKSSSQQSALPASVVTTPSGVTLRMRWLPESATNRFSLESMVMPVG